MTPGAPRLGVDLLDRGELRRVLGRRWCLEYLFAPAELAHGDALGPGRRAEFLAGRFAAKEALLKVLGVGLFDGVAPRDIAVVPLPGGAPEPRLAGSARRAADAAGLDTFAVSITHKADLVAAVAAGWPSRPAAGGGPVPAAALAGTAAALGDLLPSPSGAHPRPDQPIHEEHR